MWSGLDRYFALSGDMRVLEIGCGTGQFSFILIDRVKELVATDFSKGMIDICNEENEFKNVRFSVEDGTNLSFDDSSFDAVVVANTLHIIPDTDAMIR